ncbi:uncharacterized protein LOC124174150 [Ischnura elegans]|uniref:uncharacterized protein LOC124174150 n=1 Tax=Ischnura elegans TaxID=197161 RepID=UPI001ED87A13|nr:uncharacterized protein LOC124174150 [Ischnura elegans]
MGLLWSCVKKVKAVEEKEEEDYNLEAEDKQNSTLTESSPPDHLPLGSYIPHDDEFQNLINESPETSQPDRPASPDTLSIPEDAENASAPPSPRWKTILYDLGERQIFKIWIRIEIIAE